MKDYLITDRSEDSTKFYAGLNGWVDLPSNAVWFTSKEEAYTQIKYLKDNNLDVEEIENFD